MKLKGAVTVNAPQEEVWRIFVDPVQLCRVIPGCENARQLDKTHYEAMVTIKVQFITILPKCLGTILEAEAPPPLLVKLFANQHPIPATVTPSLLMLLFPST